MSAELRPIAKADATTTIPPAMTGGDYFACTAFGLTITAKTCTKRQEARTGDGKPVHRPCGRRDGPNGQTPCAQGRAVLVALHASRKHDTRDVENVGPKRVDPNDTALDDVPVPAAQVALNFDSAGMTWRVARATGVEVYRVDCRVRGAWSSVGNVRRVNAALRGAEAFNKRLFPGCASASFLETLLAKVRELGGEIAPVVEPEREPRAVEPVAPVLASPATDTPEKQEEPEEGNEAAAPAETPAVETIRARVAAFLAEHPHARIDELQVAFPGVPRPTLRRERALVSPGPAAPVVDNHPAAKGADRTAAARASLVQRRTERGAARDAWVDGGRVGAPVEGICEVRGCHTLLRSDSKGTICSGCRHRGERAQAFDAARPRPVTDEVAAVIGATTGAPDAVALGPQAPPSPPSKEESAIDRVERLIAQWRRADRIIADIKVELAQLLEERGVR